VMSSKPSARGHRLPRVVVSPKVVRYRRRDVIEWAAGKGRRS
jgi:hypothetical protein